MDPTDKVYLITGGVTDGSVLDLANFPHAATALQRVAGVYLDYHKLLDYGLSGLYRLTEEKQKEHPQNDPNFYEGMRMALKTVMKTLEWYADQAAVLQEQETNQQRKDDLKEMERICRKLVYNKPETFREAIQLVIIYTLIDGAREWGRIDEEEAGIELEAGMFIDELSRWQKFMLQILKYAAYGAKLIVMDGVANEFDAVKLRSFLERMKKQYDLTFIYISGIIDRAAEVSDRIYIMR